METPTKSSLRASTKLLQVSSVFKNNIKCRRISKIYCIFLFSYEYEIVIILFESNYQFNV